MTCERWMCLCVCSLLLYVLFRLFTVHWIDEIWDMFLFGKVDRRSTGSHSLCVSVYWNFIEYIQPTECGKPAAKQLVFFSLTFCVSYIRNSFALFSVCLSLCGLVVLLLCVLYGQYLFYWIWMWQFLLNNKIHHGRSRHFFQVHKSEPNFFILFPCWRKAIPDSLASISFHFNLLHFDFPWILLAVMWSLFSTYIGLIRQASEKILS